MTVYEACVGSYVEAIAVNKRGAHRIELCDNLLEGGTTPSYGTIKMVQSHVDLPIMVIIRPRGGDFTYCEDEVNIMIEDIKLCKEIGVKGVVLGALKNNEIDIEVMEKLIKVAKPLSITFHMAFDEIENQFKAIDILHTLGVDRILTSGKSENAISGKGTIKALVDYAKDKIIIMPGKGITVNNRQEMIDFTNVKEIHGTKIV